MTTGIIAFFDTCVVSNSRINNMIALRYETLKFETYLIIQKLIFF